MLNASLLLSINMGNCLRNNKISAQEDHENYDTPPKTLPLSKLEAPRMEQSMKKKNNNKKKKVRFNIQNYEGERENHDGNFSRSVRIRVVMTQEELKRVLLRCKGEAQYSTSLEQLLDVVKLRGGRISEVGGECHEGMNSWKPSLHSIPEDRFINLK